ncbi:hypothetical protein [Pedobacter suwonensis]|uniref:hypothetical protein n=1 Tax=Pedobacter suwonensis TaxID=332999 RepID=UPI0025CF08E9|nr:hypothetical protein [uncultured Pedobacter sp.]
MGKLFVKRLYQVALLLAFLRSLNAWFTWDISKSFFIFSALVSVLYFLVHDRELEIRKHLKIILLYVASIISLGYGNNLTEMLNTVPIIIFLMTTREFKTQTLDLIVKLLSYFLIVSLILFLLSFFISLPNLGQIEHPSWDEYVYTNYIFFIKGQFYDIRFNSIFLEPGHLGMVLAFLLFAVRFNFKRWEVWVMILIEIFTLSLAGYILVAIGYFLNILVTSKSVYRFVFYVILIFGSLYLGGKYYNNGNNLLNTLIIARMEYDQEKGIAGNNRATTNADEYLDRIINNGDIWIGMPQNYVKDENLGAGWKIFLIRYGLFSLIVFALFYYQATLTNLYDSRKYNLFFLMLIAIAFLQRSYPWWESWIIPFVSGMSYLGKKNKNYL